MTKDLFSYKHAFKVAYAIIFLLIVASMFLPYSKYKERIKRAEDMQLEKLAGIARTTCIMLDGDDHEYLRMQYSEKDGIATIGQEPIYDKYYELLKDVQQKNHIETGLYTIFLDEGADPENPEFYYFGIASTETPFFRHRYETAPDELKQAYLQGGVIHKYETPRGMWLSACAPIMDSEGNTIAALVVDQKFDTFIASARSELRGVLLMFGVFSLFALGSIYILRSNHQTVNKLHSTQTKLMEKEKMASLGQLTAGIAHEIQNPLNFVNNFADMSVDIADDLKEELLEKDNKFTPEEKEGLGEMLDDLKISVEKIHHHGKRADNIVRNMLMHSRGGKSEKRETDLNQVMEEYTNLAFHGMRGVDKTFQVKLVKNYAEGLPSIRVIQQDVGRVFLNLLNNAFYTVHQKRQRIGEQFEPIVTITTADAGNAIEVRVRDNGEGIPEKYRKSIFTPFFTTKETGKGTGLGLSISYDIICEEHGGEMTMTTEVGSFTEFLIRIPKKQA